MPVTSSRSSVMKSGGQVQDGGEPGVPGAGVVDGETDPPLAQHPDH
ncbi:MAG: hypothetical protein M0035_07160 [Actinomycetota bacterium]|nr:hypothetical protein [Actinomycetota bacterium]